jgi:beta-glucosidase
MFLPNIRLDLFILCTAFTAMLLTSCATLAEHDTRENDIEGWPMLSAPALDPVIEGRIDDIMAQMTLQQKVGQVIQADTDSVTPEEVKQYRLGSVLSGGNSAPGDQPYADAPAWLADADEYFEASIDPEGVKVAIPIIWGIDAVHGHANLSGATVFPHNIGLGAANDPDLIEEIMEVTAAELIVSGHDWTFAPTLAVPRDDRWGRTYEGFSENPSIVASYGNRIVFGLQGRPGSETYFDQTRVISSAKHFLGDGGTTKGVDQGDTVITEKDLIAIHAAGYFPAIEAGVQTIMASFNSWNGEKMHGNKYMLTDVLKTRMGFSGFVVGDWNGHGQIPGCTNTDCPASFNAGVDMYMAPDSWKGIYDSTLSAVRTGEITEQRLDDAVRRILRVKLAAGLFSKPKPSARKGAGDSNVLGSDRHREVARRAVRQSLVLLKNNSDTLPLRADMTVLVIGDGADSVSKQAGGWTLSWQGGGYANSYFPHGESILDGIRSVVDAGGGRIIHDPTGTSAVAADVVIAVYGEDPYAEYLGDLDHLDFNPKGFDPQILKTYQDRGTPTVSVFLSGRPLWINPELNVSDAFVAAWLPGTEGGGLADVLFQTKPDFDFTGRLSYSWPKTAVDFDNNMGSANYDPLFPLGYGLSYSGGSETLAKLDEDSGLSANQLTERGAVFRRGSAIAPWKVFLVSDSEGVLFNGTGANIDGLAATRTDHLAQEDAMALNFGRNGARLQFIPEVDAVDWSSYVAEGRVLSFAAKAETDTRIIVGMGCSGKDACSAGRTVDIAAGEWREVHIPLSCFSGAVDMSAIKTAISIGTTKKSKIAIADIRVSTPAKAQMTCD